MEANYKPVLGTATKPPIKQAYMHNRRTYLTETEVGQLMEGARHRGRHGHRDATMILLAYRHGLRVSELINLTWEFIDFESKTIYVLRLKGGEASRHPLTSVEIQALLKLEQSVDNRHVFLGERGSITPRGFAQMLTRVARSVNFPIAKVHPHMLRHSCGFKLANDGRDTRAIQAFLGHRQIQHTVRYTKLSADRFKGFWND